MYNYYNYNQTQKDMAIFQMYVILKELDLSFCVRYAKA